MSNETTAGWSSIAAAARAAGLPYERVKRLARRGQIRTLRLPGSKPLIDPADLARLQRECLVEPALAGASS